MQTNHYSSMTPEDLLKTLVLISNTVCKNVELNVDKFRVTAIVPGKDDTVTIDMRVYINDFCSVVEFNKRDGCIFEYQTKLDIIKKKLESLEEDSQDITKPSN